MSLPSSTTPSLAEPPGGLFIWMLVALELLTFGIALAAFASCAKHAPAIYQDSRQLLDLRFGLANTIFLLTSGYFMAGAVSRFRRADLPRCRRHLMRALTGGALFLISKGFEYADKIDHGHILGSNPFFTWYWLLTVFHLMHVVVGMVILIHLSRQLERTTAEGFEAGGVFWHMCDLVWLLLFPALYLIT